MALTKRHQIARALSAFEYMEILGVREIQTLGRRNKLFECLPVEASDTLRIGIMLQHIVLKCVEEESIVLVDI